ncbi:MAG: esterase, partial [Candidatus Latescibacteria bacterium]|nr:esterase [Candidatus Latescibacterota bacterium]
VFAQTGFEGTAWVDSYGYSGCIELLNEHIRVILEPNCGGRILEYALYGENVIYTDPEQNGRIYTPGEERFGPTGGRCDIGPEMKAPDRTAIWLGKWEAEIIGQRAARMTSVKDQSSGIQLIREFRLDRDSTHLSFTQTIINISDSPKEYNHWSRTFVSGGGICLVPLSERSRFPEKYIMYFPDGILKYRHEEHPNVRVRDSFLEILGPPPQRKFGIDSYTGWLGYITRSNLLFVKKFPVYPERPYGELAAYTISIWYDQEKQCELEPIGPTEFLEPGERASFTEDWWLFQYDFPQDKRTDLKDLTAFVKENTR